MRMRKLAVLSLLLLGCTRVLAQEKTEALRQNPEQSFFHRTQFSITDSLADDEMLLARLRNMPNLEVGKGIRTPESVTDVLESGDRAKAGALVPAKGLVLEEVFYT